MAENGRHRERYTDREIQWLLSRQTEHRLRADNLPFDIDVWYPKLKQFSMFTKFVPLTLGEAHSILNYYDCRYKQRRCFRALDVSTLRRLEERIDEALRHPNFTTAKCDGSGSQSSQVPSAFPLLCSRSQKDGEPHPTRFAQVYPYYLKERGRIVAADRNEVDAHSSTHDSNAKGCAIARTPFLQVSSGKEPLSLLLTSERACTDLDDWLRAGEPEQVVLRAWEPGITLDHEFRVFVYENRLTAITQYDHYCVYPHLAAIMPRITAPIHKMWCEMHEHVGEACYIADFAYIPAPAATAANTAATSTTNTTTADRVVVVELSPFLPCTGPALFSWTKPEDLQVMKGLKDPTPLSPEVRLNSTPHPALGELI
jgi:hypothetical protein